MPSKLRHHWKGGMVSYDFGEFYEERRCIRCGLLEAAVLQNVKLRLCEGSARKYRNSGEVEVV